MSKEYKSGITGKAVVRFGGRIATVCGSAVEVPDVLIVAFCETKQEHEVGDPCEGAEHYGPQVELCFPDLKSLDALSQNLDNLETEFKRRLEEGGEHETKSDK